MTKRADSVEETRRRIVEATVALHAAKGIQATSWQDIAQRADVAVGTVYYHFPTFDELIPACSALGTEQAAPPTVEIYHGLRSRGARLERLVDELFAFYERGRGAIHNMLREMDQIPALAAAAAEQKAVVRVLIEEALRPSPRKDDVVRLEALLDFRVWQSLTERGIGKEGAVRLMIRLLECAISSK